MFWVLQYYILPELSKKKNRERMFWLLQYYILPELLHQYINLCYVMYEQHLNHELEEVIQN